MGKPKLRKDDLVQNLHDDFSEKDFLRIPLPRRSVGRVRRLEPIGRGDWAVYAKFYGHPLMPFRPDELRKVRL